MNYILLALWILMWGAVGYLTVRVILACIAWKREEKAMAAWYAERMKQQEIMKGAATNQVVYNPVEGDL